MWSRSSAVSTTQLGLTHPTPASCQTSTGEQDCILHSDGQTQVSKTRSCILTDKQRCTPTAHNYARMHAHTHTCMHTHAHMHAHILTLFEACKLTGLKVDIVIDDLRKSGGLHSVNAYRHGLYIQVQACGYSTE